MNHIEDGIAGSGGSVFQGLDVVVRDLSVNLSTFNIVAGTSIFPLIPLDYEINLGDTFSVFLAKLDSNKITQVENAASVTNNIAPLWMSGVTGIRVPNSSYVLIKNTDDFKSKITSSGKLNPLAESVFENAKSFILSEDDSDRMPDSLLTIVKGNMINS